MTKVRSKYKNRAALKRVFLALRPDEAERQQISELQSQFARSKALIDAVPVKYENLHLTLHFLGDVNNSDILNLSSSLAHIDQSSFNLTLDKPGYFSKPKILWLGARELPAELIDLVKKTKKSVRKVLKNYRHNDFIAHVTLFRKAQRLPEVCDLPCIQLHLDKFALVESVMQPEGVKYLILEEWDLN